MFGLWKVTSLSDKDSAGAERIADVVSCMNGSIEGTLYLPPYLRPNQCGIAEGSVVVGFIDNATGKGAAFCGIDEADYGYFMDADVQTEFVGERECGCRWRCVHRWQWERVGGFDSFGQCHGGRLPRHDGRSSTAESGMGR